MKSILFQILLLLCVALSACDKLHQKGMEVVNRTKESFAERTDNIFPTYDHKEKDTDKNRRRFKEHLAVELTPDVRNIYAYGDFQGADYKVLLAFTCDRATIERIVAVNHFTITSAQGSSGLLSASNPPWWKEEQLSDLVPYKYEEADKDSKAPSFIKYLWYDNDTKIAYYQEFSL